MTESDRPRGLDRPLALLNADGVFTADPHFPLQVDPTLVQDLYRDMVMARRVDTEATALQRTGELGLWSSCLGQEAAQVGSAHAMLPGDFAFPTYRESAVAWCRGVDPVDLLQLYRGTVHGGWDPHEHGFALFTIVLASQVLHAVGYAMGMQRDGAENAVLAYFGDGASSEGDVHEAMVFATVNSAPVVLFCQNNGWAISEPVERQTTVPFATRAAGYGMPAVRIDGNDVLMSLAATSWALNHARSGNGPVFIEAVTYRMGAHTTSDDPTRYRPEDEWEQWADRDPIERLRRYMIQQNIAQTQWWEQMDAEEQDLARRIREAIRGAADPAPLLMFEQVYAEDYPQVERDKKQLRDHLASLGGRP
jgi:2-oxoisovalerate dehydrogenase E1 component alpha subunit